ATDRRSIGTRSLRPPAGSPPGGGGAATRARGSLAGPGPRLTGRLRPWTIGWSGAGPAGRDPSAPPARAPGGRLDRATGPLRAPRSRSPDSSDELPDLVGQDRGG